MAFQTGIETEMCFGSFLFPLQFTYWVGGLSSPYQSSPLKGALAHSTVKAAIDGVTHYSYGEGPLLSMAALTVEHLKVLMVEHLKVLNSRACLRILNSRAPKGDGGLNSRACLRILMVEHLKVLISRAPCRVLAH